MTGSHTHTTQKSVVLGHTAAAASAGGGTGIPEPAWDVAGTGHEYAWTKATFMLFF